MKQTIIMVAALAVLAVSGGLYLQAGGGNPMAEASGNHARVNLRDAENTRVGGATLTQRGDEVVVSVTTRGLTPGFHGFHVHAVGVCEAPFTSAGGHFDLPGNTHPAHSGDMPVLLINADGTGEARFKTQSFGISDLFDADGSAIIIHTGPDNYANIPTRYSASGPDATTLATGDSGARAACGVVREGG
jgi:Cu-Zn family superoxide dismutase